MNIKRVIFWLSFAIVLFLIIWGLIVAMNKSTVGLTLVAPAPITPVDHVLGSSTAPVTLIEYSDFQCPACEAYYPVVEQVLASSTVPTRFVYRHFPLSQHPNAIPSALAAEAANVQGKFWDMYRLLFENHSDWTELADPNQIFVGYATKLGLDIPQFKTDIASSTLKDIITADSDEGIHIGINGTPTFFLNSKVISTPKSYDEFISLIQTAASSSPQ